MIEAAATTRFLCGSENEKRRGPICLREGMLLVLRRCTTRVYFGGSSGSHVTISREDPQQLLRYPQRQVGWMSGWMGSWGTDNGEPQRPWQCSAAAAAASKRTPAWKPQRICKGKIDAMQAKSITGGQVRDSDKARTLPFRGQFLTCGVLFFPFFHLRVFVFVSAIGQTK